MRRLPTTSLGAPSRKRCVKQEEVGAKEMSEAGVRSEERRFFKPGVLEERIRWLNWEASVGGVSMAGRSLVTTSPWSDEDEHPSGRSKLSE